MNKPYWWPTDYFDSRSQFIELCIQCGAQHTAHTLEASGPNKEPLTVDVASLTTTGDQHVIFITSGVHGVEGFLGASAQISALESILENGKPDGTSIIMIHAVNPWGYAHLRRVDDYNVDINRNFSGNTPASHEGYGTLDPIINPNRSPSFSGEFIYWFNTIKLILRNRGVAPLFKAIAQGQYDYPKGVFFGGTQISESTNLLQRLITELSANFNRVSILDIHSGLGPSAKASLIGNTNAVEKVQRKQWLTKHYGNTVYIDTDESNAYNANGTFSRWCQEVFSHKLYLYLCVEIGTVNPITLFSALRRENQAHHWASSQLTAQRATKQALLNVFAPNSRHWRNKSVEQAMEVLIKTSKLPSTHVNTSEAN